MSTLSRARWVNLALVVCALLALFSVIWTRRVPRSAELEVRRQHLLPVFRQEQVDRVEIQQGAQKTVLVRNAAKGQPGAAALPPDEVSEPDSAEFGAEEFRLIEPFETDADVVAVEKLLGSLRYATWERQLDGPLPLGIESGAPGAVLGEHSVSVHMGELAFNLRLGQETASPPGSRYVEVAPQGGTRSVYVVKRTLIDEVFVDGAAFRGRQIVPYGKSSVRQIVLSSAAGLRRFQRTGHGFAFDEMQDLQRAERTAIDRIFIALARAVAEPFLEVEVAKAALSVDAAAIRVSLLPTAADKPEASLELGGVCPDDEKKAIAIRHLPEPLAGCIEPSVLFALREPASTFIDHGLFSFAADEVDTIRIVEGERTLDFARSGEGFVLRGAENTPLDPEAAADRLQRILGIRAEPLTGAAKPAGADQYSNILISLESSSRPGDEPTRETVKVGPVRADGSRYVMREADGAVLEVSAEAALALRADTTLLKQPTIFDYPIRDVAGVSVSYGSVKQTLERSPEGGLELVLPKGYAIDGGLAIRLIDELRSLRALRWVEDSASKGFGLDKPRAVVRLNVTVNAQPIERVLTLGRSAPGGFYASVDRDPGVFVVHRSLDRVLGTWLLDRSVFSADRESIAEVTLAAEGRGNVLLKRVAGQLTVQKASAGFDASRIDELVEALEALRPEAAVHPGAPTGGEGLKRPVLSGVIKRQSPKNVGMPPLRFSVGSRDSFQDASIYYARHGSVNATYALPRQQVEQLLDLF